MYIYNKAGEKGLHNQVGVLRLTWPHLNIFMSRYVVIRHVPLLSMSGRKRRFNFLPPKKGGEKFYRVR